MQMTKRLTFVSSCVKLRELNLHNLFAQMCRKEPACGEEISRWEQQHFALIWLTKSYSTTFTLYKFANHTVFLALFGKICDHACN